MDGQLLRALYHELLVTGKHYRPRRCTYSDNLIVFLYFFAVLQNASLRRAHDRRHWPLWMRRLPRISYSELMRRLATPSVQQQITAFNQTLRARLPQTREKCVDGKPLPIGVYTKDREAHRGLVAEHFWAHGYKLHAVVDSSGAIDAFCVTPLNAGEATAARERLRAILDLEQDAVVCRAHRLHRACIEQAFGHLTNLSFGLFALPNSVRRLVRVERWILAKIAFYHLYLGLRQNRRSVA